LPLLGSMHELDRTSIQELPESDSRSTIWDWEWRRIFGHARFDAAVDFSGYSSYWTRIVAHASAPRKVIWLHNDLVARSEEHTSELQSRFDLVCRLLLEKKKTNESTRVHYLRTVS